MCVSFVFVIISVGAELGGGPSEVFINKQTNSWKQRSSLSAPVFGACVPEAVCSVTLGASDAH